MNNVTIYDVAGKAKCSLATVSRVLNNPQDVKKETRERVLKVIEDLGYKPNAIARGLAARKSMTIGVISSENINQSTAQFLAGIMKVAKEYKYSIRIFSINRNNLIDELNLVLSNYVDGIIFLNDELDNSQMMQAVEYLKEKFTPFVLTNVDFEGDGVSSVNIDYIKATYEITNSMIKDGKKKIALLSSNSINSNNFKKETGYLNAINESNLTPIIYRDIKCDIFNEIINTDIDGIISFKDSSAIQLMNGAIITGKKIPDDISIVGLQNTKYALLSRPTLTCLNTPVFELGTEAMTLLTKLINKEVENHKVVLPYEIIKRNSY